MDSLGTFDLAPFLVCSLVFINTLFALVPTLVPDGPGVECTYVYRAPSPTLRQRI